MHSWVERNSAEVAGYDMQGDLEKILEEIDELQRLMPPDEEMPDEEMPGVNNSDNEMLSQEEIDMLLSPLDNVPEESESELRDSLIDLRNTLRKYESLLSEIENLSDVVHCDFCIEGEEEEPYWAEKLSKEQKKKFDEILVELKQLPSKIRTESEKVLTLAVSDGLTESQIDSCKNIYMQIASQIISYSFFVLSEKIKALPLEQLEQVCAVRFTVLLASRQFFKHMFSLGTKSPCFAQMDVLMNDGNEKSFQQFFEGKSSSPYFSYYADTVLSLNIACLNLSDKEWQYLNYLGIETLEELCALPLESIPELQDEISSKLARLGLCFGTSREDLLAVCAFPLVIKHYGGAGFYELYHPFDRLGTREVIREGDGKRAERKVDFAMIRGAIDMILDLGGTLMHVPSDTKTFKIPFDYTTISSVAFVGCDKLEELTISKDVYEVGAIAFDLPSLKELRYDGTVAEWKSIKKDKLWNLGINVPFVKCSDGKADC